MKLFFTLAASLGFVLCFFSGILVGDGTINILVGVALFASGMIGAGFSLLALDAAVEADRCQF